MQTDKQTKWNGKAHVYVDAPGINALTHNVDGSPKWKNPTDVIQRGDSVGIPVTNSRTVAGECHYAKTKLDPKFKCPECAEGYHHFEVRDYYRKSPFNMPMCDAHAGWWNDNHPFGPHAVPTSAPKF